MFADAWSWLRAGCLGIVILDASRVALLLRDVPALSVQTDALAIRLKQAFERPLPIAADVRSQCRGVRRCRLIRLSTCPRAFAASTAPSHPCPRRGPRSTPTLLEDGRGLVPGFTLDVFPPQWARWIEDSAESAGTPIDYVAQGVLAAVSAVCGAGVMAQVSTAWAEPLVLWQALVGWPSSGKSPALAAVRRLLGDIEHGLRDGDGERRNRHRRARRGGASDRGPVARALRDRGQGRRHPARPPDRGELRREPSCRASW